MFTMKMYSKEILAADHSSFSKKHLVLSAETRKVGLRTSEKVKYSVRENL